MSDKPFEAGRQIGQYEIVALLGSGGMASVYRAHQRYSGGAERDVVLKVFDPRLAQSEEFVARFNREARTLLSLSHPHILKAFDFGQDQGIVYLVMELMTGGSLVDLIRSETLPFDLVIRLVDQVGSALDYAHKRGIIHRDLKPHNVLLDEERNAFLTDFGIIKLLSGKTSLTHTGTVMGTPMYVVPEQWESGEIDARSDLYSLGIMIFEMLTGQVPFGGDTPMRIGYQHVNKLPPLARDLRPELPPNVDRVLRRALAKNPADRYPSAAAQSTDLRAALSGLAVTAPPITMPAPKTVPMKIFISYSRGDSEFALRLYDDLKRAGFDLWIDQRNIHAGNWDQQIAQALKDSTAMIVILSPKSMASENVTDEWSDFLDQRKPIVPILLEQCEIPFRLKRRQRVDFTTSYPLDKLIVELQLMSTLTESQAVVNHAPLDEQADSKVQRRLEAAMPQQTKVSSPTDLWIKVSLPDSEGLRGELPAVVSSGDVIRREDARSSTFPISFPKDPNTGAMLSATLCVEISSKDFRVQQKKGPHCDKRQAEIELLPNADSRTLVLILVPKNGATVGRSLILVNLFYEGTLIAQTSVSTEIVYAVSRANVELSAALLSLAGGGTLQLDASAMLYKLADLVVHSVSGLNSPNPSLTESQPSKTEQFTHSLPEVEVVPRIPVWTISLAV